MRNRMTQPHRCANITNNTPTESANKHYGSLLVLLCILNLLAGCVGANSIPNASLAPIGPLPPLVAQSLRASPILCTANFLDRRGRGTSFNYYPDSDLKEAMLFSRVPSWMHDNAAKQQARCFTSWETAFYHLRVMQNPEQKQQMAEWMPASPNEADYEVAALYHIYGENWRNYQNEAFSPAIQPQGWKLTEPTSQGDKLMRVLTMMVQRLWVRLPAPVQKAMQPLIQWVKTYSYAASCIAAVLLVTLWVNIHPVAVAVTAMTQFQSWRVEWQLNREARRYVWCYHRYNPQPENTHIYGAFAGTHPEEVLRFHEVASWLLRSPEQEKSCYRTWRDAADATASFAAEFPALVIGEWNMPTPAEGQRAVREERYRRAVLGAVLDRPVTGLTSGASWCLSRIHTEDYHIYHVPHPVGGREEVERVLEQLSERTHIQHYRINKTACFAHALQAVDWLEKELVTLPDGSSLTDYAETLHRWLGQSANAAG